MTHDACQTKIYLQELRAAGKTPEQLSTLPLGQHMSLKVLFQKKGL